MPKVRVCVKDGPGRVRLDQIQVPDPKRGQVLVRTERTTICGSDLHLVDRVAAMAEGMPQGHEAVGVVEAVGEGVERIRVGDRVASTCLYGCGACHQCEVGDANLCATYHAPMNVLFGCQGEAFLISSADSNAAIIPPQSDARNVLLATDIMATGFTAVRRADLKPGQTVAIFAQGPVGLCATAAAKYHGAARIFAVDGVEERQAMAKRLGATDVLAPDDAVTAIREATKGVGVDLAIEALGSKATFQSCLRSIRLGGTVSSVGMYFGQGDLSLPTKGAFFQHKVITSMCPAGHEVVTDMLSLLESGQVDLLPLFTHEAQLGDIVDCYDRYRKHADGVLKFSIAV